MGGGVLNPFCQLLVRMVLRMDLAICKTRNLSSVMTLKSLLTAVGKE